MFNAGARSFPRSDSYTTNGRTNGQGHGNGQTQGRLKDAPMDFQWTNRSPVKPVWKSEREDELGAGIHPSSSSSTAPLGPLAPLSTNTSGRLVGRGSAVPQTPTAISSAIPTPAPTTPSHASASAPTPTSSTSTSSFSFPGLFSSSAKPPPPVYDVDMNEVSVEMEDAPLVDGVGNVSVEMSYGGVDVDADVDRQVPGGQAPAPTPSVAAQTSTRTPAQPTSRGSSAPPPPPPAAPRKTMNSSRNARASVPDGRTLSLRRPQWGSQFDEDFEDEDDYDENGTGRGMTMGGKSTRGKSVVNTNNHYTLHLSDGYIGKAKGSEAPYVLLGYLQFFFNLSLLLIFLYIVVQFIVTLQRDLQHRIAEETQEIIQEITLCKTYYTSNLCIENRVPAMSAQCASWATCMNRDPRLIKRTRILAELMGDVLSGFVDSMSWKVLVFGSVSMGFLVVFGNLGLSLYRAQVREETLRGEALRERRGGGLGREGLSLRGEGLRGREKMIQ